MIHLTIRLPDGEERKQSFDQDMVRLGRQRDNDFPVQSLSVSRYHARIEKRADGLFIVDLDSRNGLAVNGEPVRQWRLEGEGEIVLGDARLEYIVEEPPRAAYEEETIGLPTSGTAKPTETSERKSRERAAKKPEASSRPTSHPAKTKADSPPSPSPRSARTVSGTTWWHLAIESSGQRVCSTEELRELFEKGEIPATTIVWKKGMRTGAAISEIPEFSSTSSDAGPSEPTPPEKGVSRRVDASDGQGDEELSGSALDKAGNLVREGQYDDASVLLEAISKGDSEFSAAKSLSKIVRRCLAVEEELRTIDLLRIKGNTRKAVKLLKRLKAPDEAPLLDEKIQKIRQEVMSGKPLATSVEKVVVNCPGCGAKNRVPRVPTPEGQYRCGKCKMALDANSLATVFFEGMGDPESVDPSRKKCAYCGEPLKDSDRVCPLCNHQVYLGDISSAAFRQELKTQKELQKIVEKAERERSSEAGKKKDKSGTKSWWRKKS